MKGYGGHEYGITAPTCEGKGQSDMDVVPPRPTVIFTDRHTDTRQGNKVKVKLLSHYTCRSDLVSAQSFEVALKESENRLISAC